MGRSLGFGCAACNLRGYPQRAINTRFRFGCGPATLTLLHTTTPRIILQKARRHTSYRVVLRLLVGTRLQDLLFPFRGASHLSLTILVHYRSLRVFSLRAWSPQIHAEFHGFRVTWEFLRQADWFRLQVFHLLWIIVPERFDYRSVW